MAMAVTTIGVTSLAFAQASGSAKTSKVNLNDLRKIAKAGQLYHQDFEAWPRSAAQLVDLGRLPKALLRSPADTTKEGIAREVVLEYKDDIDRPLPPNKYFDSYTGYDHWPIFNAGIKLLNKSATNGGWLVDLTSSTRLGSRPWLKAIGPYRRFTFDGGVIERHHIPSAFDPRYGEGHSPLLLFTDQNDAVIKFHRSPR
jgi:hypothetical protein